jgi:hypothetical protein
VGVTAVPCTRVPHLAPPRCAMPQVLVSKNVCHGVVYDQRFHFALLRQLAAGRGIDPGVFALDPQQVAGAMEGATGTGGAAEDGAAEDGAAEDGAAEGRTAGDRAAGDRAAGDRAAGDRAAEGLGGRDGDGCDVLGDVVGAGAKDAKGASRRRSRGDSSASAGPGGPEAPGGGGDAGASLGEDARPVRHHVPPVPEWARAAGNPGLTAMLEGV